MRLLPNAITPLSRVFADLLHNNSHGKTRRCTARCTPLTRFVADLPRSNSHGKTPLHCALSRGWGRDAAVPTALHLMAAGADINAEDSNGERPLHVAARHNMAAIVERLVEMGAEVGWMGF